MPTPFQCHLCDKPTMNKGGICDNCITAYEEGQNAPLGLTIKSLEERIEWLEKGLSLIASAGEQHNPIHLCEIAKAHLDGEPTTADEHNVVYISDINKEIAEEMEIESDRHTQKKGWKINE